MQIDRESIERYIIENQAKLKLICRRLYSNSYLADDLFQEFYLAAIEKSWHKSYPIPAMCYYTILTCFKNRYRKGYNLSGPSFIRACDNLPERIEKEPEYLNDLTEFIESEMNRQHGFAPVTVFMQAQEESLRDISKRTKIPLTALSNYKRQGQKKLQMFLK